jgi:hypothetical protein
MHPGQIDTFGPANPTHRTTQLVLFAPQCNNPPTTRWTQQDQCVSLPNLLAPIVLPASLDSHLLPPVLSPDAIGVRQRRRQATSGALWPSQQSSIITGRAHEPPTTHLPAAASSTQANRGSAAATPRLLATILHSPSSPTTTRKRSKGFVHQPFPLLLLPVRW